MLADGAEPVLVRAALSVLLVCCNLALADEAMAPDIEFLEYLGSWEESDEDWLLLAAEVAEVTAPDDENETAPVTREKTSAEVEDEN